MSITLIVKNFRCYEEEKVFNFDNEQIIRIKGESGIGKTTIFEAIQWCLYRYPINNIEPLNSNNKNTYVKISIPWKQGIMSIERKKNPSLLIVKHANGIIEENDVAQASIDSFFGNKDIWRTCCYLPQSENCPLLGFSNEQRMRIVESLSFISENPDEDIEKIDKEIMSVKEEIAKIKGILDIKNKELNSLLKPQTQVLSKRNIEEINKIITEQNIKLLDLKKEIILASEKENRYNQLEKNLISLQKELSSLINFDSIDINKLEKEISDFHEELIYSEKFNNYQKLINKKENLVKNISKINKPEKVFDNKEYQESVFLEKKYSEEIEIAKKWKIDYQEDKIKLRIKYIQEIIENQNEAKIWLKVRNLRSKLDNIQGPEIKQEDVIKIKDEISILERSLDILKCPSCNKNLRHVRNTLILAQSSPVSGDKIKKLKLELLNLEQELKKTNERKETKFMIDSLISNTKSQELFDKVLTDIEIKKLQEEIKDLNSITFISLPKYSSIEIEKSKEYFLIDKEISSINKEIFNYQSFETKSPLSIDYINKEINNRQDLIKKIINIESKRQNINKRIEEINKEKSLFLPLLDIKKLEIEIEDTQNNINNQLMILENNKKAEYYFSLDQEIANLINQEKELNNQLSLTQRLKDLAQKEIAEIINEKISGLNIQINDICNKIFNSPIVIELDTLKTTKTTKTTKPCLHLKIWYKNIEYDSLSQMSGGEAKRVSLAVSLALSQLNNFPMILLDECLNGLNDELKETTLEALRSVNLGKAILLISHDTMEGYYDQVIDFN